MQEGQTWKPILVGLDASEYGLTAASTARTMAAALGCSLEAVVAIEPRRLRPFILLEVEEGGPASVCSRTMERARASIRDEAGHLLDMVKGACRESGVPCRTHIEEGGVDRALARHSEEAELLVLGRQGEQGQHRPELSLGGNVEAVLAGVSAPVFLCGAHCAPITRIIAQEKALETELPARIARALGAKMEATAQEGMAMLGSAHEGRFDLIVLPGDLTDPRNGLAPSSEAVLRRTALPVLIAR